MCGRGENKVTMWELIKMAFDSIFAHKLRSFLTMLGIVIGVASVIVIVAIGQGGTDQLTESFAGSKNTLNLVPKRDEGSSSWSILTDEVLFTQKDIEDLKRIPEVKKVLANQFDMATIYYRDKKVDGTFVLGMNTNDYLETSGIEIAQGRLFHPGDYQSASGGIILSDVVAKKLFPKGVQPIGQIVRVHSQPLKVIGVMGKAEGLQGLIETPQVYLTSTTWRSVFGKDRVDQLTIQVTEAEMMKTAGEKAVNVLNRNHGKQDGYEVENLEQLTEGITKVANIMTIVIGSIGGISLLVGGIGVMNIMLVSVTERTREIGIRKALGATRGNILFQFLVESMTLSMLAGAFGILLASITAGIINGLGLWPATVSIPVAIGGLLFSMLFGVVFGILPANQAAKLNPIDCLRYE